MAVKRWSTNLCCTILLQAKLAYTMDQHMGSYGCQKVEHQLMLHYFIASKACIYYGPTYGFIWLSKGGAPTYAALFYCKQSLHILWTNIWVHMAVKRWSTNLCCAILLQAKLAYTMDQHMGSYGCQKVEHQLMLRYFIASKACIYYGPTYG